MISDEELDKRAKQFVKDNHLFTNDLKKLKRNMISTYKCAFHHGFNECKKAIKE